MPVTDPTDLVRTVRALAASPSRWLAEIDFDPVSRHYARIADLGDREAWLLTWLPGQGTGWHDHGDSAGAFTVVSGQLREETADRTDDGLTAGATLTWSRGSARRFGTEHVHRVTNTGIEPAISLHVYAPRLTVMNRYDRHDQRLVLADATLAGADW